MNFLIYRVSIYTPSFPPSNLSFFSSFCIKPPLKTTLFITRGLIASSYIPRHTLGRRAVEGYKLKRITKGGWFFTRDMMEVNGRISHCNEKRPLENSTPPNEQKKTAENSNGASVFVNHAAIAWNESRRKWIGDVSKRPERSPKDLMISWSTTYEDLLSTNDLFSEPIPLTEMVDFLVDIWHDEGLYD